MKKESEKRGDTTEEEVKEHLGYLKSDTAKINYIEGILGRVERGYANSNVKYQSLPSRVKRLFGASQHSPQRLISDNTQKALYEELANLYIRGGDKYSGKIGEVFNRLGKSKKELALAYANMGKRNESWDILDGLGENELARQVAERPPRGLTLAHISVDEDNYLTTLKKLGDFQGMVTYAFRTAIDYGDTNYYARALNYALESKDPKLIDNVKNNIRHSAKCHLELGRRDNAIFLFEMVGDRRAAIDAAKGGPLRISTVLALEGLVEKRKEDKDASPQEIADLYSYLVQHVPYSRGKEQENFLHRVKRNAAAYLAKSGRVEDAANLLEELGDIDEARVLRKRTSRLERSVEVTALIGLVSGAFFLSSNVTGNAISNLSNTASSWIGGVLILIGVIALGFWIKNKKGSKKK